MRSMAATRKWAEPIARSAICRSKNVSQRWPHRLGRAARGPAPGARRWPAPARCRADCRGCQWQSRPRPHVLDPQVELNTCIETIPSVWFVGGAQNGIFCRLGYLLANAWRRSAGRNCSAWSRKVWQRSAGPSPPASSGWPAVMTIRPRIGGHRAAPLPRPHAADPDEKPGLAGGQPGGALAGRRRRSAAVSSPVEISSSASCSRARGPRSPGAPSRT